MLGIISWQKIISACAVQSMFMTSRTHNGTIDIIGFKDGFNLLITALWTHAADNDLVLDFIILCILQHHNSLIPNTRWLRNLRSRLIGSGQDFLSRRNVLAHLCDILTIIHGNAITCSDEFWQAIIQCMIRKGCIAYLFSTHILGGCRKAKDFSHHICLLSISLIEILVSDEDNGIRMFLFLFHDIWNGSLSRKLFCMIFTEILDLISFFTDQRAITFHIICRHDRLVYVIHMETQTSSMNRVIGLFCITQFCILLLWNCIVWISHVLVFPFCPVERQWCLSSHHRHIVILGRVKRGVNIGLITLQVRVQVHHQVVERRNRLLEMQELSIAFTLTIHPNSIMRLGHFECTKKNGCMGSSFSCTNLFIFSCLLTYLWWNILLCLLFHLVISCMLLIIRDCLGFFLCHVHRYSSVGNLFSFTCNIGLDVTILMGRLFFLMLRVLWLFLHNRFFLNRLIFGHFRKVINDSIQISLPSGSMIIWETVLYHESDIAYGTHVNGILLLVIFKMKEVSIWHGECRCFISEF